MFSRRSIFPYHDVISFYFLAHSVCLPASLPASWHETKAHALKPPSWGNRNKSTPLVGSEYFIVAKLRIYVNVHYLTFCVHCACLLALCVCLGNREYFSRTYTKIINGSCQMMCCAPDDCSFACMIRAMIYYNKRIFSLFQRWT